MEKSPHPLFAGFRVLPLALLIACGTTGIKPSRDSAKLEAIITEYAEAAKRLDPYSAPYFSIEEDLEKFGDYLSPEYFEREKNLYRHAMESLKQVRFEDLSGKDQRTYRLFKEDLEVSLEKYDFPWELLDFNQMENRLRDYIDNSSRELTSFPFDSVKHYDAFLRRAEGFPAYVDRQIDVLRRGIRKKIVLNCVVAKKALNSFTEGLEPDVEKNPFWRPVRFMPEGFSPADRARLSAGFRRMVTESIQPAFRKFESFFRTGYLRHCRPGYGIGGLPRGKEWYAYQIRANTNLALDARAVHEKGRGEVARIASEMDEIRKQLGFPGDRRAFVKSLVNDPKYFFTSSGEMFRSFEKVKSGLSRTLPSYFSLVPKADYQVVEAGNPEDVGARYKRPTDALPYGRFIVNTKNLRAVPVYEVSTLSLHEAVPGHHFQLALQFEMKGQLSDYQRLLYGSTAFVEGWALYAEYLGREMGVFADPLQRMGNLNDEMLRAVRLVVDTGIHALGWPRDRVIRYMREYLASDLKDIETEADRYSVWPGQALAYKVGQLKIIELRKLAEKELGAKFDLREFHRAVIGNGTVSLGVLETQVRDWIARAR